MLYNLASVIVENEADLSIPDIENVLFVLASIKLKRKADYGEDPNGAEGLERKIYLGKSFDTLIVRLSKRL